MVLTSILIGLGIAELLYGVVRTLRSNFQERIFIPQVLWGFYLFLHLLGIWWSRWDLHEGFEWNFLQLLLSLTAPILLFLLSGLVFPLNQVAREHYFQQRPIFFNLLILVCLVEVLHETFIEGTPLFSLTPLLIAVMLAGILAARITEKEWVHYAAALNGLGMVGIFIILTVYELH